MRLDLYLDNLHQLPAPIRNAISVLEQCAADLKNAANQDFAEAIADRKTLWLRRHDDASYSLTIDGLDAARADECLPLGLSQGNIESVELYDEGPAEWPELGLFLGADYEAFVGQFSRDSKSHWQLTLRTKTIAAALNAWHAILHGDASPTASHNPKKK
jgi:hypothetical protein